MKETLLFFLSLATISCIPIGDGSLKVTGSILVQQEKSIEECSLNLYLAQNEKLVASRKIKAKFDQSFVISPSREKYYFGIDCSEALTSFKTKVYEVDGRSYATRPLNLGEIVLPGK